LRAALERRREPALRVRERHVDVLRRAPHLDEPAERLLELVLAERDRERPDDRDGDDGDAGQRLLRLRPRLQLLPEHLAVVVGAAEAALPGADRVGIVPARPRAPLHEAHRMPQPRVNLRSMTTARVPEELPPEERERAEFAGVLRFYELAKRQEWQVRELP